MASVAAWCSSACCLRCLNRDWWPRWTPSKAPMVTANRRPGVTSAMRRTTRMSAGRPEHDARLAVPYDGHRLAACVEGQSLAYGPVDRLPVAQSRCLGAVDGKPRQPRQRRRDGHDVSFPRIQPVESQGVLDPKGTDRLAHQAHQVPAEVIRQRADVGALAAPDAHGGQRRLPRYQLDAVDPDLSRLQLDVLALAGILVQRAALALEC